MIDDSLHHPQYLHTHVLVLFFLDLLKADIHEYIQVIDVEKILRGFLWEYDGNSVKTFVKTVAVTSICEMQ